MSYVLIVGAKSDIAKAVARAYAREGYHLYLAARDVQVLGELASDINLRMERDVKLIEFDILDYKSHQPFYDALEEKPAGVISAVGYLGDQEEAQSDHEEAMRIMETNFTSIACLFNIIANDFEQRRSGFIVGISSVAGDRGRKRNYIYGAAKAGLSAYLSGLRNRLYSSQVHVLTVKPGFVDTKMTSHMDLPAGLTAQPERVASDIIKAQQRGIDVLYTKWIWRYMMIIIRMIPERIFKGLSI